MDFNVKSMPCRMHKSSWLRKSLNIMRCIVLFILLGNLADIRQPELLTIGEIVVEYGKHHRAGCPFYD